MTYETKKDNIFHVVHMKVSSDSPNVSRNCLITPNESAHNDYERNHAILLTSTGRVIANI